MFDVSFFHSLLDAAGFIGCVWGFSWITVKGINKVLGDEEEKFPSLDAAKDAALRVLLTSLEECFDEWEQEKYYLVHKPSRVRIWTANEDYALRIHGNGWEINRETLGPKWRKRIWQACGSKYLPYKKLVASFTPDTPLKLTKG